MPVFGMPGDRTVTVIRGEGAVDETRFDVTANVQPRKAFLALDSRIETGDVLQYVDGRGMHVRRTVGRVDVFDSGTLDHLEAELLDPGPPRRPPIQRVQFEGLHPEVIAAAGDLFADGHYGEAIFKALIALEVRVRTQSGSTESGVKLMFVAFDVANPLIDLSVEEGASGVDEQAGLRFVFAGVMQGIRNPKGHALVKQDDPQRAIEYLALVSVLFRRLDDAELKGN